MNEYKTIWKNISRLLKYAKKSIQEGEYQAAIYVIITDVDCLAWPIDRVVREYPVQMGSTKKSDIVLLDSNLHPFMAIEVKLSNSACDGVEQLGSYMDRCNPRLVFGMTIKDSFNLFYDENTGRNLHSLKDAVITVSFDNPYDIDGIKIVELLSFQNFDITILKSFCEERLRTLRKKSEREVKKRVVSELLTGESGKILIQKTISQYLVDNSYIMAGEEDIVDEIIEKFSINTMNTKGDQRNILSYRPSKIKYKFIPSKEDFVEQLKSNTCYRHYVLNDGSIETQKWSSGGGITVQTLKPNINSTLFFRKNKTNIIEIILSPYQDPDRER